MENEFQYRLLKVIADRGITASELSRLSGVDKSAISNYINGVYRPKQDKIYHLAKALNVDPGWLMTGEEPKSVKEIEDQMLLNAWHNADDAIRAAVRKLLDI